MFSKIFLRHYWLVLVLLPFYVASGVAMGWALFTKNEPMVTTFSFCFLALGMIEMLILLMTAIKNLSSRQETLANQVVAVARHQKAEPLDAGRQWPWGSHHTELLGHLAAAAARHWNLYDPSDPSTAPTNEMVAEWLREERGVSKEKAQAIASILRADGLKTGPRR